MLENRKGVESLGGEGLGMGVESSGWGVWVYGQGVGKFEGMGVESAWVWALKVR